jgi:hypothetical protein
VEEVLDMWRCVREDEVMLEHTEELPEMGGQLDALEMLEMPTPAPAPPLSPMEFVALTTRDLATGRADGGSNAGSPDLDATPSMLMSSPALAHGLVRSLGDSLKTLPSSLGSARLVYACLLPPDEAGAGSVVLEDEEAPERVARTEAQMGKHRAHCVGSPFVSVQLPTGTLPAAMPAESVGNEAKAALHLGQAKAALPLGQLVTPPSAAKPGSACVVGAPVRPCAHATSHAYGAPTTNGTNAEDDEVAAMTRGHSLGIRRPPSPRHAVYAPSKRSPMLISGRVSPRLARGLPVGSAALPFAPRSHSPRPRALEIIGTTVAAAAAESAAHEVTEAEVESETEAKAEAEPSTADPCREYTVKYMRISPFPGGIATECTRTVACPVKVKRAVTPTMLGGRIKFVAGIAAATHAVGERRRVTRSLTHAASAAAPAAAVATHAATAATLLVLDPRLSTSPHPELAAGSTETRCAQPLEHTRERTSGLKRKRVRSPKRDVIAKTRVAPPRSVQRALKTAFLQPLRDALQEARADWRELYRKHHTRHMPRCLQPKYPRWSPRGLLDEPPLSLTARNTSWNTPFEHRWNTSWNAPLSLDETASLLCVEDCTSMFAEDDVRVLSSFEETFAL